MNRFFQSLSAILMAAVAYADDQPKLLTETLSPDLYIKAEIVVVVPAEGLKKYVDKVQAAANKDPEWFRAQSEKTKPGVPLPYDPKLGLTKEEYDDYIKLRAQSQMQPVEKILLNLTKGKKGLWNIAASGSAQVISTLSYDAAKDTFTSPNGVLTRIADIKAEATSPMGVWSGHEWRFSDESGLTKLKENIAFGKTGDGKFGLIVYRFMEVSEEGTPLADKGILIRFPLGMAGIMTPDELKKLMEKKN
jgi:hypothetical protein